MATIQDSTSNADGATTTSSAFHYSAGGVIKATCLNGATLPSQPCRVWLQLSPDNVNWQTAAIKLFGLGQQTYITNFKLADYQELAQQFGYTAWTCYRLKFVGNVGAAVTVAAADNLDTVLEYVPLVATTSTGGGGVASWRPPGATEVYVTRVILRTSVVSTGAATLTVGTAAANSTSSGNLITTADVHTATIGYDNITNASTSGKAGQLLAAGSYVTATGSADTTGLVGYLEVMYARPNV